MVLGAASPGPGQHTPRGQRFRALRHAASEFGVPLSACAWHSRLLLFSAECENLSLHGLLLRARGLGPKAALVAPGDPLSGVHLTLPSGEVVFHGEAGVRHLRSEGPDLLLGLALDTDKGRRAVDLSLLYRGQARHVFAARCDEAERAADTRRIRPAFKEWVADLRAYLESMRLFLDHEETALASEDRYTRDQVCEQYLAEVGPRVVERVHAASHRLAAILDGLTEEEHALHRAYGQQQLCALFAASPFMRRAWEKPLGYAGDYELMNMLYRPHEEGATLFGQVMNLCWAREAAARANINRISYLTEQITAAVRARPPERVVLARGGGGPAREIEALLHREPALGAQIDVMLIDQDARAIAYCERRLSPLAAATGARLHYVRESIRRLLTGGSLGSTMGPRDLIYSAGLFDYLSERSFATLLGGLYDAVRSGGKLLIGNVDISNPTRYLMEYFGEWYLIHRSAAQLLDKARFLRPVPRAARVESEPLGVNLFLVVEK